MTEGKRFLHHVCKSVFTIFVMATSLPVSADNIIRTSAPIALKSTPAIPENPQDQGQWIQHDTWVSGWIKSSDPINCTEWLPEANRYMTDENFLQQHQCTFEETLTTTQRQIHTITGEISSIGEPAVEVREVTENMSRQASGTSNPTITMTVGQYSKIANSGIKYWGYQIPEFSSRFLIKQDAEGTINQLEYRGYKIHGLYYAADGTNAFVVAYASSAPDVLPSATVDGVRCTGTRLINYNNTSTDVFQFTGCGSGLSSKTSKTATIILR